ncbi:hypothetical protein [Nocardioides szechwanensis]|uniref:hypothetical protein n=1 Tax=Nocardioides szechwanensis TaxID=1005944 RepID=UPI001478AEAB|nr:hypothetical protein [Nocardioides szechwanensis]
MPESDRAGFVTEVRLAMDEPVVDYLRLVTMPALAEALEVGISRHQRPHLSG